MMRFINEFDFLSNMYIAPFVIKGVTFRTVEHAFQYYKTQNKDERLKILNTSSPYEVKKLGRKVTMRHDWNTLRLKVMEEVVKQKFLQNPNLLAKLKKINQPIIETNTWNDTFWGVCNGKGLNHLGLILESLK